MRDIDAANSVANATFELHAPKEAAPLIAKLIHGAYPAFKEGRSFREGVCVHKSEVSWEYQSTSEHRTEDGDDIPTEDRLLIDNDHIERHRRNVEFWHGVLTAWAIPHDVEIADPLSEPSKRSFGLAFDGPQSPRGWDSQRALSAEQMADEIAGAESLDDLRETIAQSERDSAPMRSLDRSAAFLPERSLAETGRHFAVFCDILSASEKQRNQYQKSQRSTPLQIASMAESAAPETWKNSLGQPMLETIWRHVRAALWENAFDELPAATQWGALKAEAQSAQHFNLDNHSLWAQRAQALAKSRPELISQDPLSAAAAKRLANASPKVETPAQEQQLLAAALLVDSVLSGQAATPSVAKASMRL